MSQVILNGFIAASTIALVAVGFAVIYTCARFFHIAHGAVFALGAYCFYLLMSPCGLPCYIALPVAVLFSSMSGCTMYWLVYRRLRRRTSSPLILLLASLGIYVILQNMISISFGDETKTVRTAVVEGMSVFGARITFAQVLIVATSATLLFTMWILSKKTRIGLAMRAVAEDSELAGTLGISNDKVMLCAFGLGSALAGVAGVLVALDVDMTPTMGLNALLLGAVAAIAGGVGSISGVALGALLMGMAQHLGVWWIGAQWQDAITFVILLAFLFVRPEGVMGKKLRKATA